MNGNPFPEQSRLRLPHDDFQRMHTGVRVNTRHIKSRRKAAHAHAVTLGRQIAGGTIHDTTGYMAYFNAVDDQAVSRNRPHIGYRIGISPYIT